MLIARALAQQPRVLLMDEPTNHLDIGSQHHVLEIVRARRLATVVVLHDLNLAARYCDRVLVLEDGRIRAEGPPADALEQAQVLVRSGRVHPGHRLDRKVCIFRVYGVDDLADGLYAELPGLAGEVLLIGAVPAGPARAEDVDAAACADAVGQFQLTDRVADRRLTPVLVGVQHVAPHADFGNRQAVRLRRGDCCVDEGGVVPAGQVKVDGLQAQALLALRPVFRRGVRERG